MSFSKADLPYLKWSVGAFVLSLALSGGLLSISEKYQEQAQQERQTAQKQLTEARAQLSATENDQENMATYALEYNTLLAQKIIGNEQRLDWMEGLEKIRQQGQVLDFKYTIAPQHAYTPDPLVDAGNFQLGRSDMTMQIDLLHEEQLIRLLAAMRAQMKGWFMLDGCTLARIDSTDVNSPLKAECSGGWFTMKNKSAP